MIKPFKNFIKRVFIPDSEYTGDACNVDDKPPFLGEDTTDYDKWIEEEVYTGVPAPVVPPSDPWFQDPPRTQKQLDYMERETQMKKENQDKEDPDIHQILYEMAARNWTSVKETQDDGWQSGTGYNQFRG